MRITRRSLLRGEASGGGVHISSLVVHCRPEKVTTLIEQISDLDHAQVPEHSPEGKLVVLLETASQDAIMQCISAIEELAGVINAALVYHQIDQEMGITS